MPHLVGYDADFMGDESFDQSDHNNTLTEMAQAMGGLSSTAIIIGVVSLLILIGWEQSFIKKNKILNLIPGPLVVVLAGLLINEYFIRYNAASALANKHLVSLPVADSISSFFSFFTMPKFSHLSNTNVWTTALTLAIVASLETLLGIEAVDKLDPLRRVTPANLELKAQGIGNIVSGLIGGLPLTSVVVRSSANVTAGAKTKVSAIMHGVLLLACVMFIPAFLNKIPLSALAAILIFTGYKLVKFKLFKEFYKRGWDQFLPFVVTVIAILLTDLLIGIMIGILVGLFFMVRSNFRTAVIVINDHNNYLIRFRKDVSFLNKPIVKKRLEEIPENAFLLIDVTRADFIDKDIIEEINNFLCHTHLKNINAEIKTSPTNQMHLLFNQPKNTLL